MSDADKKAVETTGEPEAPNGQLPDRVKFEARPGKEIEVDSEKAVNLMRQGLSFSQKMEAFNKEKAQLKEAAAMGNEFLRIRDTNPDLARSIYDLANGKQPAPSGNVPSSNGDQFDPEAMLEPERVLAQKNAALESRLAALEGRTSGIEATTQERIQREQAKVVQDAIHREAKAISHWDDEDVKVMAPQAAAYMQANDCSAEEAVTIIASQDAQRLKRLDAKRAEHAQDGARFRMESPHAGSPIATPPKAPPSKKEDLASGKVMQSILDGLGSFKFK